jgi:uncharacterized protein YcnI
MKRIIHATVVFCLALFSLSAVASAHVTIDPKEAVVGRQAYSVRVPNEKDIPTTELRLVVPDGVEVTGILPIAGWTHKENRAAADPNATDDDGHPAQGRIAEITWSGGKINPGEYQLFTVNTNYPGEPKELTWKAYQKYSDNGVVAWDGASEESPAPTVLTMSESKFDTLKKTVDELRTQKTDATNADTSLWFAFIAVLFSVAAFIIALKKK